MSNKRKIKRSWDGPGREWMKTGDDITAMIDDAISTDVQPVMVNSNELIKALKENLAILGELACTVDDSNEDLVAMFMLKYNGAITGMINLLCTLGVYSREKCIDIQRMFFFPEGWDE